MRREKKSDSLEVRLPHSQKRDFMEICKDQETTASDVVRAFISGFIEDAKQTEEEQAPSRLKELSMTFKKNPRKTFGATAGALGAFALFAGTPSMADDDVFGRLDKNGDGKVTAEEISPEGSEGYQAAKSMVMAMDIDDDGALSNSEFQGPTGCVVRREDSIQKTDGEDATRVISIKMAAYNFSDPEMNKISITTSDMTIDADMEEDEAQATADSMMDDLRERLVLETGDEGICNAKANAKMKVEKRIEKTKEIEKSR
ncbi:hypothetical protein [Parvularcula marina]|uniref:EF-hand domain-containing protein n=1 Tax=Parvularcula marina TaxID=2292771 RepID=A0A371RIW3_9PROT|nr:hypothetical protein [Parvularcula marina]RFB05380.1 hypothetical protein DX908_08985 [Parvularcula marina]